MEPSSSHESSDKFILFLPLLPQRARVSPASSIAVPKALTQGALAPPFLVGEDLSPLLVNVSQDPSSSLEHNGTEQAHAGVLSKS